MSRTAGPTVPLSESHRRKLADARTAAGLSQASLAARIEVVQAMVSRVESGDREPSLDLLERWCAELGLTCQVEFKAIVKIGEKKRQ